MKLAHCVLPALAFLAFSPDAFADRFYFGPAAAEQNMAEGDADFIEGVLLEEVDDMYVIRIEGGEIRVPKASVRKIESDALTADAIASRESDRADYLAEANSLRAQMLAAEASARIDRMRDVRASEASARREAPVEAAMPLIAPVYDPVLDIVVPQSATANMIQKEFGGIIRRQMQKDAHRLRRRR